MKKKSKGIPNSSIIIAAWPMLIPMTIEMRYQFAKRACHDYVLVVPFHDRSDRRKSCRFHHIVSNVRINGPPTGMVVRKRGPRTHGVYSLSQCILAFALKHLPNYHLPSSQFSPNKRFRRLTISLSLGSPLRLSSSSSSFVLFCVIHLVDRYRDRKHLMRRTQMPFIRVISLGSAGLGHKTTATICVRGETNEQPRRQPSTENLCKPQLTQHTHTHTHKHERVTNTTAQH